MQPIKIKDKTSRVIRKKDTLVKLRLKCPCCGQHFKKTQLRHRADLKRHQGATLDCAKCGALLIIKKKKVQSFHRIFGLGGQGGILHWYSDR